MSDPFLYQGSELDLFSNATNWKSYWCDAIRSYLGTKVLEVGAGTGANTGRLCNAEMSRWVALEPDAGLAERMKNDVARSQLNQIVDVCVGTISKVTSAQLFDTVLYIDVIEHIFDDEAELVMAFERLQSGGHLVILTPAHQFLFTPFDKAIGHFRRYNRASIAAITPPHAKVIKICYLDSVGLIASLTNRLILKSSMPSRGQILFWDRLMVPASRLVDRLTAHRFGKSVLAVWQKC